jgi:hypothetical protein
MREAENNLSMHAAFGLHVPTIQVDLKESFRWSLKRKRIEQLQIWTAVQEKPWTMTPHFLKLVSIDALELPLLVFERE